MPSFEFFDSITEFTRVELVLELTVEFRTVFTIRVIIQQVSSTSAAAERLAKAVSRRAISGSSREGNGYVSGFSVRKVK